MSTFGHTNIKHPYVEYSLADAIRLANAEQVLKRASPVASLKEARDIVKSMVPTFKHNWITGANALDVLDAAIDGRDLATDNRSGVGMHCNKPERPRG
jgi:uncharacterized protein YlxP (DUF503 family)